MLATSAAGVPWHCFAASLSRRAQRVRRMHRAVQAFQELLEDAVLEDRLAKGSQRAMRMQRARRAFQELLQDADVIPDATGSTAPFTDAMHEAVRVFVVTRDFAKDTELVLSEDTEDAWWEEEGTDVVWAVPVVVLAG